MYESKSIVFFARERKEIEKYKEDRQVQVLNI
jgi:hypothetical protein